MRNVLFKEEQADLLDHSEKLLQLGCFWMGKHLVGAPISCNTCSTSLTSSGSSAEVILVAQQH